MWMTNGHIDQFLVQFDYFIDVVVVSFDVGNTELAGQLLQCRKPLLVLRKVSGLV